MYPVKPEAFLDAILDPQTGENVDLQMNFEGLQAAVDLRQVSTRVGIFMRMFDCSIWCLDNFSVADAPWLVLCCWCW